MSLAENRWRFCPGAAPCIAQLDLTPHGKVFWPPLLCRYLLALLGRSWWIRGFTELISIMQPANLAVKK